MADRHEDSDEDTYVMVGTAFDPLETPEDVQRAKVLKEKEQYVTDSQGRRRFHGAFTGGFSAGYFNTVGTKEGWTPSTFVSSRDKKAEHGPQKPEDFMDDEDFDTHGIAPREVAAKDEFSRDGLKPGVRRPQPNESRPSVIPGEPPLQNLIVPAQSTIGTQLLKAMGWREGEGVGPKVIKYPARPHGKTKMYGCALPGAEEEEEDSSFPRGAEGFQFAPHDVTPWQFEGKDDMHGIGYRGMEEQEVLRAQKSTKALYGMSGQAFGIGALEVGDDDDDVYGTEAMTSYDVTLAGEGDITMERKYGWTGGQDSDSWSLSSFAKTRKSMQQPKKFPPPLVPRDFVPLHKFTALVSIKPAAVESHRKPLSSTERTHMLADKPGSVFSLMAAEDRERLRRTAELAKQGILPLPASVQPHPPAPQPRPAHSQDQSLKPGALLSELPHHSTSSSNNSSSKFTLENLKPFASNPAKQARYEAYLAGRRDSSGSEYSNMTEWECQREREEFSRAARIQQPLTTSSLASRFTKEQGEGQGEEPREGETRRSESPETDAVQAARAGMFGVLTREVLEWQPHKLLCKKFNVPDPYPSRGLVGEEKRPSATRTVAFLQSETMTSVAPETPAPGGTTVGTAGHSQAEGLPSVSSGDSRVAESEASSTAVSARSEDGTGDGEGVGKAKEESELVQPPRPPMDLFKAIFAESSESSESEHGDSDMETEMTSKTTADTRTAAVTTESRTTNHGRPEPHGSNTSQGTSESGDFLQKRWQDFSLIANKPAAAPLEPTPHLSLPRAPPHRETDPATLRQRTLAETRRDGQKERSVVDPERDRGARDGGARDGGVRDGGMRDRGARDGGARDRGARDGGVRDRDARDGGARDRGVRDGGVRDGGARDRGETRTEKLAYGPSLPPQVHSASDSESSPDTSHQRKPVRKHSTYKHHKKHKKTKREGHKEHKKSKHKH